MAEETLPPVVTELKGEIADLLGKLTEAKAALDAFNADVAKKSETSAKETGRRSAQSLLDEFKNRLRSGTIGDLTNDEAWQVRRDISKAFEKAGADGGLKLLQQFSKALGPEGMQTFAGRAVVDAFNEFGLKGGIQAGGAFSGGFMGVLKGIFSNPATATVGVVAGASIISALGAALQGLTLGAIGGGGLAAGIVGQLQDPAVKSAASDLGAFMKAKFLDASSPLHDDVLASIGDLERQTGPIFDTLKANFQDLEPYLRPLIDSIGVFFKTAGPGWTDAVKASGPVLLELARDAQMMGNAFSIFFREISDNKGAVEGLDWLMRVLAGSIVAVGGALEGLSNLFDVVVHLSDWMMHNVDERIPVIGQIIKGLGVDRFVDGIAKSYDGWGLAAEHLAQGSADVTKELNAQKDAVDKLRNAYDAWFTGSMQVDQANLALHQDLTNLTDSLAQNRGQWTLNTKAGQDHYAALLQAIQGAKDLYDAEVKQYGDSPKFRAEMQKTIDGLLVQAGNAGLDASQIQQLRAQFGGLLDSLNSLDGKVVHYSVIGSGGNPNSFPQGLAQGGFVRAAQGLLPPRSPGTLVLAGEPETGGEVMIPQRGISRARAAALGSVAMAPYGMAVGPAGGGGMGPIVVQFVVDGRVFHQQVVMPAAQQHRRQFGTSGLSTPYNPNYPTGNTF